MKNELQTLLVNTAVTIAHVNTIEDALLAVCKELLPQGQWQALAANFYEKLYTNIETALTHLPGVPADDLQRAKFDALEYRNAMMRQVEVG